MRFLPGKLVRVLWLFVLVIAIGFVGGCAEDDEDDTEQEADPDISALLEYSIDVHGEELIAVVDERFLSVAVDSSQLVGGGFWSDTGEQSVVGTENVEPFDFSRRQLRRMTAELLPAYLRVGGSEADRIYYDMGPNPLDEPPPPYELILHRDQYDALNDFALELGFEVLFTLNAGPGPRDADNNWTVDNARVLMEYTVARDYPVVQWELGNEINAMFLVHGLFFWIDGAQYAADMAVLRDLKNRIHPEAMLAGPSSAFWPILGEPFAVMPDFLKAGGDILDVITWHYYPQQSDRCPVAVRPAGPGVMMVPDHLDEVTRWADHVNDLRDRFAPQAEVWLGETGNAQCGGQAGVSDAFVGGFWWLDQLGSMAVRGQPVVVRQSLTGANYGLIDQNTLHPRPDYWNSILWKRLMGTGVLDVDVDGKRESLRAYAHCTNQKAPNYQPGAVTLVLLNLDPIATIRIALGELVSDQGKVYELSSTGWAGRKVFCNGVLLWPDREGAPPAIESAPLRLADDGKFELTGGSYAFVVMPQAQVAACQ